jgi:hypothetical protein
MGTYLRREHKMTNLQKALNYYALHQSLSFHHVGQKFHIDPSYLQLKWGALQKEKVKA